LGYGAYVWFHKTKATVIPTASAPATPPAPSVPPTTPPAAS